MNSSGKLPMEINARGVCVFAAKCFHTWTWEKLERSGTGGRRTSTSTSRFASAKMDWEWWWSEWDLCLSVVWILGLWVFEMSAGWNHTIQKEKMRVLCVTQWTVVGYIAPGCNNRDTISRRWSNAALHVIYEFLNCGLHTFQLDWIKSTVTGALWSG